MNWKLLITLAIEAIARIKLQLLSMLAVFAILIVSYVVLEKPQYKTSWMLLLPGTERSSTINLDDVGESRSSGNNAYGRVSISPKNTYKEIALSTAVINRAAKAFEVRPEEFEKPIIKLIDQTPAMMFTLKGTSLKKLAKRASIFNVSFHETLDNLRSNELDRHYKGIEGNLAIAKKRLKTARQKIVNYQINGEVISDAQYTLWVTDAEQLRNKLTSVNADIASATAEIKSALKQYNIDEYQINDVVQLQSNPEVDSTTRLLGQLLSEQSSKELVYAKGNPVSKELARKIRGLEQKLNSMLVAHPSIESVNPQTLYGLLSSNTSTRLQTINRKIAGREGLNAQANTLQVSFDSYQARIKTHTKDAANLADLSRDHQIAEAIFSSALAKLDTSRLDIYATYPLTQLLTQPGETIKEDKLQKAVIVLALIMVYLMLAASLILIEVRKKFAPHTYPQTSKTEYEPSSAGQHTDEAP